MQYSRRFSIGLVINPFAGIGGAVALKGSDGEHTRQTALALGATPKANHRVTRRCTTAVSSQPDPLCNGSRVYGS